MPVNTKTLSSFVVSHNISWQWVDTAPGANPPPTAGTATGTGDSRRTRFVYDFFLTAVPANGSNIASTITDEITISLAGNPHFPGSQPPGCLDPSR
jgi:hypothetical protein